MSAFLLSLFLSATMQAVPPCTDTPICEAIALASEKYGVPYRVLECLAFRESTYRDDAVNGRYAGIFQFDTVTWALTPMSDHSRFDPYAAADGAAYLISINQGGRWPPLAGCR